MSRQSEMSQESEITLDSKSKSKAKETGLKHGQFKVQMRTLDNETSEHIVNPPTQEDYAEGWNLILPRERKNSTTHHFSIYLSQLPPHLWKLIRAQHNEEGSDQYAKIFDNIYHYTVKKAKTDNEVLELYKLVTKQYPDREQVTSLYKSLEQQRVKGWVMIRAKNIMNQ